MSGGSPNPFFMSLLSIFKLGGRSQKLRQALENGALVVDVRSPREFKSGHARGSMNIPLDTLSKSVKKLQQKNKPVVACCASGMRSARAAQLLRDNGVEAINGGPWHKVNKYL